MFLKNGFRNKKLQKQSLTVRLLASYSKNRCRKAYRNLRGALLEILAEIGFAKHLLSVHARHYKAKPSVSADMPIKMQSKSALLVSLRKCRKIILTNYNIKK